MTRRLHAILWVSAFAGLMLAAWPMKAAEERPSLARQVKKIFQTNCYRCHGEKGAEEGGIAYITDLSRLVEREKIVPGDVKGSTIYRKLTSERSPMPPETDDDNKPITQRPSTADIALVRQWIEAGAPPDVPAVARPFISDVDILVALSRDLGGVSESSRPFTRYFTITHLYNAGFSEDELQTYRGALSKLLNSLSWGKEIVVPAKVDAAGTIYRIDLRDYFWNEKKWQLLLDANPYALRQTTPAAQEVYKETGCNLPYVRADWFVAAASRPPLYHDLLGIPGTDAELEKLLQVDVAEDIRTDRVDRAGFNGSGVSQNNRLLERHRSTYGAYWKSYDFRASREDRKNLFAHPLGPGNNADFFAQDGGEIIFNLPNGLQGYMLVNGTGARIDKGPIDVVSDTKQKDRAVVNGVSCMRCHFNGMIEKQDQVREAVLTNSAGFNEQTIKSVKELYPTHDVFDKKVAEDKDRFMQALEQTGVPRKGSEPVFTLANRFESDLDLRLAAAEAGMKQDDFGRRIGQSKQLAGRLGVLNVHGGTVSRTVFVSLFGEIAKEFNRGIFVPPVRGIATVEQIYLTVKLGETPAIKAAAFRRLLDLADSGSAQATAYVGYAYLNGFVVAKDEAEALRRFRKSAEAGDGAGLSALGYLTCTGEAGATKDEAEAVKLYRKAAKLGDGLALCNLGIMYERGQGGLAKDDAEALRWYRRSVDAGFGGGMTEVGHMYEYGLAGLAKDEAEAVRWYQKAADAGDEEAMKYLGDMYVFGHGGLKVDYAEAIKWYRKSAEAGSADGMYCMGEVYRVGTLGLPQDEAEAVKWYRMAAEAGDGPAMAELGKMYLEGFGGLPKDETEAVRWFRKGSDTADPQAMFYLGCSYDQGRGGLAKDDAEAVRWYRKSADAGNDSASNSLGLMYEQGRGGLPKDAAEAVRWYTRSADEGNSISMYMLGYRYEEGKGVAKDHAKARFWMQKSADAGLVDAKHWLEQNP